MSDEGSKPALRISVAPAAAGAQSPKLTLSARGDSTPAPQKTPLVDGTENLPALTWMLMEIEGEAPIRTGFGKLFGSRAAPKITICVQADRQPDGAWLVQQLGLDAEKGTYTKPLLNYGTMTAAEMLAMMQAFWAHNHQHMPADQAENPSAFGTWLQAYQQASTGTVVSAAPASNEP